MKLVDDAVNEKYKAGRNDSISGNELIVRDVLMAYLLRILNTDKAFAPFTVHKPGGLFQLSSCQFILNGSHD